MKKTILTTVAALSMLCTFAQWKPVGDKIKTPWAEKVDPANVLPEYPRPQMVRSQWVNLNGLWDYAIKPVGAMEPKTMDGKILVPFAVESSLSGVQKGLTEKDELWYRRTFSVPAAWKGSNVLLNFGAVDWKADVFVNDILAGSHTGGFTPFSLDITPYLKAKGEQKLVVRVFDGTDKGYQPRGKQVLNPNGIWYTPVSGIWQTVWIEPVAKSHISGIKAIPNLDQKNIAVTVAAENCTTGDLVEVKILDKGKLVASATGLPGNPLRLGIAEPKLSEPRLAVPLRHGSVAQAGRENRRQGRFVHRHAQDRNQARQGRHPPHDAQRQTALPLRPARPGLVARRTFHRTDRRSAAVRHSEDQGAGLQHDPQAREGRAGALVLPLRPRRHSRMAGHALGRHGQQVGNAHLQRRYGQEPHAGVEGQLQQRVEGDHGFYAWLPRASWYGFPSTRHGASSTPSAS